MHGLATNALQNFVQLEQGFYRREPVNVKFEKVLLDVLQHRVVELKKDHLKAFIVCLCF